MFLILFSIVALGLLVMDFLYRREINQKSANLPGPAFYCPFIGHPKVFSTCSLDGLLRITNEYLSRFGRTVVFWAVHEFILISSDPKILEAILNSPRNLRRPRFYNVLRPWLGDSLLLSFGDKWRGRRKMFSAVFHFRSYKDFNAVFEKQGSILVAQLNEQCDQGAFDATRYINAATIDIITEIGMGIDRKSQVTRDYRYAEALNGVIDVCNKRVENLSLTYDFLFRILKPDLKKEQDTYIKTMHELTEGQINDSRKVLSERADINGNVSEDEQRRNPNLMDLLLQSTENGEPYPNDVIREELDALMFGGHDTVTLSILFTMYCLSRHPNVQAKVFQEIRDVIGDDPSAPVGLQELSELKYLELVLKEVLRLYPPVTAIGRRIDEDIHVGNCTIPAQTTVFIPISLIQMDPDWFPEPDKFLPERFSKDSVLGREHSYSFLAFSAGPRDCGGRKFAMLEMKSIMSKIIRHFELLPMGDEPNIKGSLMLKSTNGVNLGIKTRVYD